MTNKKYPIVHLWSPYAFHEESYVIANREGLIKLKNAVDMALNTGQGKTEVFVADGEGYDLHIFITDDEISMALPYTADYAKESREKAVYPWNMIRV